MKEKQKFVFEPLIAQEDSIPVNEDVWEARWNELVAIEKMTREREEPNLQKKIIPKIFTLRL